MTRIFKNLVRIDVDPDIDPSGDSFDLQSKKHTMFLSKDLKKKFDVLGKKNGINISR